MRQILMYAVLTAGVGSFPARAWEEQDVLTFVLKHNPVVQAQRVMTDEFKPPRGFAERMQQYTSAYGRAGVGGTDYLSGDDQPFTLQAGVQISIPLAGTRERREHAQRLVEETRALDELRTKVLGEMGALRQLEADAAATETRLEFWEEKSSWLQQRVEDGYSDATGLWEIGQQLHEERATAERLRTLIASARYQLASYAGEQWQVLLRYLEDRGDLGF